MPLAVDGVQRRDRELWMEEARSDISPTFLDGAEGFRASCSEGATWALKTQMGNSR